MTDTAQVAAIEINVGKRRYRIVGDLVWVQGFGTTGPGQTPHYSWLSVNRDGVSYSEAMRALKRLKA